MKGKKCFDDLLDYAKLKANENLSVTREYKINQDELYNTKMALRSLFKDNDKTKVSLEELLSKYDRLLKERNDNECYNMYMQGFFDCVLILDRCNMLSGKQKMSNII